MLKRIKTLFAPIPVPHDTQWNNVRVKLNKWTETKRDLLNSWAANSAAFHKESEERYLKERKTLLDELYAGGKVAQQALDKLERSFRWTKPTANAAKSKRVQIGVNSYESYVHVSESVMDRLDEVYVDTFRAKNGKDEIRLIDCFSEDVGSKKMLAKRKMFNKYLVKVADTMALLTADPEMVAAFDADLPQAHGLRWAAERLSPLFSPVEGRICLPLPTASMLEDLRTCVLMDPNVVCEVRGSAIPGATASPTDRNVGWTVVRRSWEPYDSGQGPRDRR
jgi:hypothetical protein